MIVRMTAMIMLMTTQAHNEHCDDADEANHVCVNYGNDDGNDDCITIMLVVMLTMEVHDEGNAANIILMMMCLMLMTFMATVMMMAVAMVRLIVMLMVMMVMSRRAFAMSSGAMVAEHGHRRPRQAERPHRGHL